MPQCQPLCCLLPSSPSPTSVMLLAVGSTPPTGSWTPQCLGSDNTCVPTSPVPKCHYYYYCWHARPTLSTSVVSRWHTYCMLGQSLLLEKLLWLERQTSLPRSRGGWDIVCWGALRCGQLWVRGHHNPRVHGALSQGRNRLLSRAVRTKRPLLSKSGREDRGVKAWGLPGGHGGMESAFVWLEFW